MSEQSVAEALQGIEQECEVDDACRQTAVTYLDGVPACEYHSGTLLTGGGGA